MRLEFFGIDKLNFVEFNITGDDVNFSRLNNESRFINSSVFNLFIHCFEQSNDLYDYFEPTKYNARKIVVLRNALIANLDKLNEIKNKGQFLAFINNFLLGKVFITEIEKDDAKWFDRWDKHLSELKEVNREMVAITERCIDETRILWVIGY